MGIQSYIYQTSEYELKYLHFPVLMFGLDGAGKTTILTRLKYDRDAAAVPTLGLNVESMRIGGHMIDLWDIGRAEPPENCPWKDCIQDIRGVIFVVDSTARDRMDEAREMLLATLEFPEYERLRLLVLANKQDLPSAMTPTEIQGHLELDELEEHAWRVVPTIATSRPSFIEGITWLCDVA